MCVFSWGEILCAGEISFVGNMLLTEKTDFLMEIQEREAVSFGFDVFP